MKRHCKGSASVDLVVISSVLIVFVIMPILAMAIEKVVVVYTVNKAVDIMESTLYAMTESVNLQSLASAEVVYDLEQLERFFEERFDAAVGTLVETDIIGMEFVSSTSDALPWRTGQAAKYDTLYVCMTVAYRHVFYETVLNDGKRVPLTFEYSLEIPKNR
ncbi:MAG: hypothetical protein JXO44_02940 [Clostridia bacterium]|nr:hypothetical protein [Clostridia bacterium]